MTRVIAAVMRKTKLGDADRERQAYWASRSAADRIAEVESLRRMWIEQTGDPDVPMVHVVHKRKLGEPAIKPP